MRGFLMMIVLSIPLAGCLSGPDTCGNELVSRLEAPGGGRSAVMFQRDCGATTGFSTQISILGSSETTTEAGNLFIADDDHGAARVGPWDGPWAQVEWLGPDHLLVRYAPRSRIFLRRETLDGVRVTYRQANE